METKKKPTKKSGTSSAAKKAGSNVKASTRAKTGGSAPKKKPISKKKSGNANKVLPFVWFALALFLGACLYLNLLCNFDNALSDPTEHWVGIVGYYICYGIFGVFGAAAFTLPILLVILGVNWKRFSENGNPAVKLIASTGFLVMLSTVLHIFCVLMVLDGVSPTVEEIFEAGAKMQGGGVVGATVGNFLFTLCHYVGSIIISLLLLGFSAFWMLGMTPQFLWDHFKRKRAKKPKKDAKREKKNSAPYDEDEDGDDWEEDDGEEEEDESRTSDATRESAPPFKKKKKPLTAKHVNEKEAPAPAEKQAEKKKKEIPPPAPRLHPVDENDVFVPEEINRKLAEESRGGQYADYEAFKAGLQARQNAVNTEESPEERTVNAAANRDAAAEQVFPASSDARTVRRTARADRDFDIGDVFEDENSKRQPDARKHAPVPPEVPMDPAESKPVAKKPAAPETPESAEQIAPTDTDFGLSEEEFENLEAQGPGAAPTRQRRTKKEAPAEDDGKSTALEDAAVAAAAQKEEKKPYVLPPLSFLHPSEPMTEENAAELRGNITALGETLKNFHVGIQGNIRYSYGPTVTRYELTPAPGVRVRTITNLSDDIALALRASGGIRIEAPIPGTNTVGIEIPNKLRSTIYLRELLESKAFTESKAQLTAALGAGIAGETLVFDIAKMPHLLIAGTTGSGKSVCINCIVLSLLYRTTPEDVRLVMIDPKKVEFSIYKNIPHLLAPVVTQPKDAAGALQASVEEMERRFEYFEAVGVRDLKGYNAATADDPDMPRFPHIVIIIDELADLMMTARDEVETAICRIAQKARAAGMHLIIGTQRPSADIVTGLIKANVPSRIAFAVKSQVDSRVILDHIGAEALAGRGDMLFVPIGSMRDTRVQGAFVDDKEVESVCDFLRENNGLAEYDEHFIAKLKELAAQCGNRGKGAGVGGGAESSSDGDAEGGADDKYADAVRIAMEEKCIATSRLQRKLGIGYGRAAKLIDRMEREGIVSPPNGSKPRTILISTEEYMDRFLGGEENGGNAAE